MHATRGTAKIAARGEATATAPVENVAIRGERELLEAAARGEYHDWRAFRLRLRALTLTQTPAFDNLLALDAARGVEPMEHQISAVRRLLSSLRRRGMLCDEVGMGKTIEAGLAALELSLRGLARRVLVLAPPSLLGQWKEEMASKFGMEFIASDDEGFQGWAAHDRVIASLHTAKREPHAGRIAAAPFDLVIVDEAHHLRNARTQAFQLVARLAPRYLFLLTATPVQNSLEDLFNLVSLVRPGQLSTFREFRKRFVRKDEPLLPNNAEEMRGILREVMVRNRRATSGVRFTRRYATTVRVEMSADERAIYDDASALVRRLCAADAVAGRLRLRTVQAELGSSPAAAWPALARLAEPGGALAARLAKPPPRARKIERLVDLVREFGDRMIVFTRFQATHGEVVRAMEAAGFATAGLHGGMRFHEKQEALRRFHESARVLVSTDVGSEGRNLQVCNAVVNFDLPWNPMRIEQRIGRVSRIGQEREVYVFNLVAAGTLEDHLLDLLHAKINMFELVMGEIDAIIGHLQEERGFEEVVFDLWSRGDEQFERSLDDLARDLVEAKQRYRQVRDVEDRVFADALSTAGGDRA
ncbi:MAG: DEAD/DEAH box helicase [Planctomycetes bacterium]|nr:DEAD/DEAH box helicase [Planctomycetota bacterium]